MSAELAARRTAAAAVLADYRAAVASAPLTKPPGREWMLRLASVLGDLLDALDADDDDQGDHEDGETFTCCETPMQWPTRTEDRTCPECGTTWEHDGVDLGAGARIKLEAAGGDDDTFTCSTCGALIGMFIGRQGGWLHYRGDGTTASPVEIYDAGHEATFADGGQS